MSLYRESENQIWKRMVRLSDSIMDSIWSHMSSKENNNNKLTWLLTLENII